MSRDRRITAVIAHKVRSGESLQSLAEANGITWQQLAKFNWGTSQPEKINDHLRDHVGCTRRTANGNNYMFSDDDDPGIILIPLPWQHGGLSTELSHVIHVRPLMLVSDYEFKRNDTFVDLSFTVRGRQPSTLTVRLYECSNLTDRTTRQEKIAAHASGFSNKKGFCKSGRYWEVTRGDSLQKIGALHGFEDSAPIWEHYENSVLRDVRRTPGSLEPGDFVYVPQLQRDNDPVPLGPLLNTRLADEQPSLGKRYTARWDVEPDNYDPLDWYRWIPERASSVPVLRNLSLERSAAAKPVFFYPHFAVIAEGKFVIGVSPDPMYLVHDAKFTKPEETTGFRVFYGSGISRALDSGATAELFEGSEEPVTFFGAVSNGRQEAG